MKLAFAGTPEFSRATLAALTHAGHRIVLVLTQPDRPGGRGMKLQPSPVKQFALDAGLPVIQPRSLRLDGRWPDDAQAARAALQASGAEALVVAAYGLILPRWTLELPARGCLNVHASLLPRWRGAAPIQRAIEAGDAATGVTIMQMDEGLDTGDMLLAEALPIGGDATAATLHDQLAALGARLMVDTLAQLETGPGPTPRAQPVDGVTYASKIDKAEGAVDWTQPAALIERRVRAFDPFPGASSVLDHELVKLWRVRVVAGTSIPGQVLAANASGITVACGDGALCISELQRPGGRRQPAAAFLQARPVAPGGRFGDPA